VQFLLIGLIVVHFVHCLGKAFLSYLTCCLLQNLLFQGLDVVAGGGRTVLLRRLGRTVEGHLLHYVHRFLGRFVVFGYGNAVQKCGGTLWPVIVIQAVDFARCKSHIRTLRLELFVCRVATLLVSTAAASGRPSLSILLLATHNEIFDALKRSNDYRHISFQGLLSTCHWRALRQLRVRVRRVKLLSATRPVIDQVVFKYAEFSLNLLNFVSLKDNGSFFRSRHQNRVLSGTHVNCLLVLFNRDNIEIVSRVQFRDHSVQESFQVG